MKYEVRIDITITTYEYPGPQLSARDTRIVECNSLGEAAELIKGVAEAAERILPPRKSK